MHLNHFHNQTKSDTESPHVFIETSITFLNQFQEVEKKTILCVFPSILGQPLDVVVSCCDSKWRPADDKGTQTTPRRTSLNPGGSHLRKPTL